MSLCYRLNSFCKVTSQTDQKGSSFHPTFPSGISFPLEVSSTKLYDRSEGGSTRVCKSPPVSGSCCSCSSSVFFMMCSTVVQHRHLMEEGQKVHLNHGVAGPPGGPAWSWSSTVDCGVLCKFFMCLWVPSHRL